MAAFGTSLNAVNAAGAGSAIVFDEPKAVFSLQTISTGGPSYTIYLELSCDGVNWFRTSLSQSSDTIGQLPSVAGAQFPAIAARANLTSISGGSSPTVTASIAAH